MTYLGDFRLGDTLDHKFTTAAAATGLPTTLAGSPVISAYVGNSTTQLTAGITLSVDFDGVTGLHNVRVVASGGNGYATASNYQLVITTGTVGGTSAVGYVVGSFSIEARSALMPTTAGRTAVVDAAGLVDANMVKAGPTGAGTAQTARDLGTSVLISSGTGTGQLSVTSGVIAANTTQLGGSTSLLANLSANVEPTLSGTISTAVTTPTATTFGCSDITEATASHYLGKQCWVRTGTMAKMRLGVVTAYSFGGVEGNFTVSPGAPTADILANGTPVTFY